MAQLQTQIQDQIRVSFMSTSTVESEGSHSQEREALKTSNNMRCSSRIATDLQEQAKNRNAEDHTESVRLQLGANRGTESCSTHGSDRRNTLSMQAE